MRFSDLKPGDHFFLEGREYTKTSPVLAKDTDGKSRLIPRSAVLQVHPQHHPPTTRPQTSELDRLYHAVISLIRQEVRDSDLEIRLCQAIETTWQGIKDGSR